MNIKKILFALIVTSLLIGSVCAASINDFKVDGYNSSYNTDINSAFVNNNGDSGVSIFKNANGARYYDYDDDGYYDYDDDGYDYDDAYDHDYDDIYDHDYDDDYVIQNSGNVYNGIRDDMQITKNSDNTATFTDVDDAEHGIVEVVQHGGEQYTVVFWAKDASNINNTALMTKLTNFNKDNGVTPVAF
ncbi:hypothetical protein [Methanobrevibacter sp.]|uniref:hypothetical protein n=1 Tax=Methanobrevibacter sp. TaxID=66852 RepID=UPI00388E1704